MTPSDDPWCVQGLGVARTSTIKARTQAINALKALVVTAPEELHEQLHAVSTVRLVQTAAALEPLKGQARGMV